jgi:hypothetical protein
VPWLRPYRSSRLKMTVFTNLPLVRNLRSLITLVLIQFIQIELVLYRCTL